MAKYLVSTPLGPQVIEADAMALVNHGTLVLVEGEGLPVAAYIDGAWTSVQKIVDEARKPH